MQHTKDNIIAKYQGQSSNLIFHLTLEWPQNDLIMTLKWPSLAIIDPNYEKTFFSFGSNSPHFILRIFSIYAFPKRS